MVSVRMDCQSYVVRTVIKTVYQGVEKDRMRIMKAIVFDVDDTLYDLSTPFKQTCREIFPEDTDLDLEGAFLASRRYSDSVYARCLSGEMSMEEMYIYRFKNAFLDYGKKINALKALEFQAVYEESSRRSG